MAGKPFFIVVAKLPIQSAKVRKEMFHDFRAKQTERKFPTKRKAMEAIGRLDCPELWEAYGPYKP